MSGAVDFVKKVGIGLEDSFLGGAERKAGQAIAKGARESAAVTREMFAETKEQLLPFIEGGQTAFQKQQALSGALGPKAQAQAFSDFQEDPGTEFLREQGLRLINSKAGATGRGGGERLRELTRFSQGLALQDLSNKFNRLGAGTGTGLTAAQALGGVSDTASSRISQAIQTGAAGTAASITGETAGIRGGIKQIVGAGLGFDEGGVTGALKGAIGG